MWTEVKLWFKDPLLFCNALGTESEYAEAGSISAKDAYKRLMVDYCKPVLDHMRWRNALDSYHFFFEDEPDWLLRIESENPDAAWTAAHDRYVAISDFTKSIFVAVDEYRGEEARYGRDGWPAAKAFFRAVADLAIARVDPWLDVKPFDERGEGFNAGKFAHCLVQPMLGGGERLLYVQRLLQMSGGAVMWPHEDKFFITLTQR